MKYASALPLTDDERRACQTDRRRAIERALARRNACPDKRHYDREPTKADKARDNRIMGERD